MTQPHTSRAGVFRRNDTVVLAGIATVFLGVLAYGVRFDNFGVGLGIGVLLMLASLGMAAWSKGGTGTALVETAAAEGLARQADQLAQAVSVFKLEGAAA